MVGIVHFVARELSFCLVADATLVHHLLAKHALVIVALLDALMSSTGQEAFTEIVAYRDRLNTTLPLSAEKALDCLVS